jgi:uncharacterized RDD family membrane protein YckC
MLERSEHLTYCKKCKNQEFDIKQGLICKLTGKIADFDPVCPDFQNLSGHYTLDDTNLPFKRIENATSRTARTSHRLGNYFIDSFAIWLLSVVIVLFIQMSGVKITFGIWEYYFFYFVLTILYYVVFESLTGKTPGKYITRTRVVTREGYHPTLTNIVWRTLARFIPFEPFSFFMSEIGWHDSLTKTLVIDEDGPRSDA